ncbi:hypothetical protein K470DRAFT_281782 [Piedraia hortae CBS 480.64]|uniref:FAD synthase n=1 Tax=Piedraia hortae CBS 480.64 TaxID=1314780 RepID=A0A6A7C1Z2_9PEZI|nr:hypothetical protein K470DRAFT_281782 [Piedraia hortae CBS 480.64]
MRPETTLQELCVQMHHRVSEFLTREQNQNLQKTQRQVRVSLKILEEAISKYGLDGLSLSYNGGKDCLVLLILYLSALHNHFPARLRAVHIRTLHPFTEVDEFVAESQRTYCLQLVHYQGRPMREAFADYLHAHPEIRAVLVGTRRADPHGSQLKYFHRTDRGWPDFVRIHPVIDWHYADVWNFIRELDVPYCSLYDRGYTSLGGTEDTRPNPVLKRDWGYAPAHELEDDDMERLGRD